MKLKKYSKYKNSGIDWIGNIPEEWNLLPIMGVCEIGRGRVISNLDIGENEGKYPVYSSQTTNNGEMGRINTYDFNGEYVTWTTDGANAGTVFYRNGKFNCTNVCGTLKQRENKKILMTYLPYILNGGTKYFVRYDINPKLMNDVMARIRIPIPPIETQQKISSFLDSKTAQIEKLIEKDKNLIELLKEKRISLINKCVTKGIEKNVKMKDSGVEWIGEIPDSWEVRKFNSICYMKGRIGWQGLKQEEFTEEGPYLITGMDFKDGLIDWNSVYHITEERYKEAPEIQLKLNDVLITKDGTIGKLLFIDKLPGKASLNSHLLVLRDIRKKFIGKYLYYHLHSYLFKTHTELTKTGTTFYGISQESVGNYKILLPKNLIEQQEIVEFLDKETVKIDSHIKKVEKRIELYEEYKKSLIYNVVTGKVEV